MSLYRRKDSPTWWISVLRNGRRIRISTDTENKRLAERIHAKVLTEIEEGRWFESQAKRRTLTEMIDRYETEYSNYKSYYQKARDKTVFKRLLAFFGDSATLQDVENTVGGYEQFRRRAGKKPATILKELSLLRRMFNVARKQWKWKMVNPVSEIELPKVRNERVRYLGDDEYERLSHALDVADEQWLKPFVLVAMDTGLRLGNLFGLTRTEVNLFSRIITISSEKMKNNDYIGIPMTDRVFDILRALLKTSALSGHVFHDDGAPLYPVKVQRAFRKVVKQAGIDNFHFHDLRHSFASNLRQEGVDLHTISVLLGHRDLRMTKRYAHLNVDSLREAVAKLCHDSVTLDRVGQGRAAVTP
jgi:integrase